ncbi:MAG: phosphatase PAP2 family protein [Terracidiphilus sp.]
MRKAQNKVMLQRYTALVLAFVLSCAAAQAQSTSQLPDAPTPATDTPTLRNVPRNLMHDQAGIWTFPVHMNSRGALEGIVLVVAAAGIGADDRHIMQNHFLNKNTNDEANTASDGLTGLLGAAPAVFYGVGHLRHDDEAQQTGVMAGEAIVDSLAVNQVIKICARRERPTVDNAKGKFFANGVDFDSSFASNHSVVAWSSAAVIASEYNGLMTKILVYGLASGVSVTRVVSRNHFPSDVLVGSAVGWMIGRYVFHRHNRGQL